ncbi:hypothetical protein B7Y92_03995 [Candidatus Saccharibacteria bacterium 32-50-13]|nr:MAG: hypothetical protein B7Y92_03995 [Candidatus Saccharibacteria bacterium 32-50-13]
MALLVRQNDERTELQKRVASELQEKMKQNSRPADRPDGVDDAAYMQGKRTTSRFAMIWLILFIVALGVIVWLLVIA